MSLYSSLISQHSALSPSGRIMKKEIIINADPDETRVAVLENQIMTEFLVERSAEQSIVRNCYKGRVATILPGMQAAFIDLGMEKAGFLHVDDVLYDMMGEGE